MSKGIELPLEYMSREQTSPRKGLKAQVSGGSTVWAYRGPLVIGFVLDAGGDMSHS